MLPVIVQAKATPIGRILLSDSITRAADPVMAKSGLYSCLAMNYVSNTSAVLLQNLNVINIFAVVVHLIF